MPYQITTYFLAFVNQTNLDLTREIHEWTLSNFEDKHLIETALVYGGGTFRYIDEVIAWLTREVPKIEIIRTEIRDLFSQSSNSHTVEFAEELSRPEDYQEYTRILNDTINVLKYVRRKRLAETRNILLRLGGIRSILRFVETASPRTYRRFLSSYGDGELDEFIENDLTQVIRQIYRTTKQIKPQYRIRCLRLEYFPSRPLEISRLPEEDIWINNPNYSELQYNSEGESLSTNSNKED